MCSDISNLIYFDKDILRRLAIGPYGIISPMLLVLKEACYRVLWDYFSYVILIDKTDLYGRSLSWNNQPPYIYNLYRQFSYEVFNCR